MKEKLDGASTKDPLIEAAEEVGVELTEDIKKTKKSVIEEIILQDFVEEVLEKLNREE